MFKKHVLTSFESHWRSV